MKTIRLSQADMELRISRFQDLEPLPIQQDAEIPLAAKDLIYSRKLLSVVGLESAAETPINVAAPIVGAAGMTMTLAVCPPGQGPSLHAHQQTYETFTVLEGRFEITWNDDGGERAILEQFDTISVPPRVNRAFHNISDEEGVLQVIITGGVHDMNDIGFAPTVGEQLDAIKPGIRRSFEARGITFTAHQNAAS